MFSAKEFSIKYVTVQVLGIFKLRTGANKLIKVSQYTCTMVMNIYPVLVLFCLLSVIYQYLHCMMIIVFIVSLIM